MAGLADKLCKGRDESFIRLSLMEFVSFLTLQVQRPAFENYVKGQVGGGKFFPFPPDI